MDSLQAVKRGKRDITAIHQLGPGFERVDSDLGIVALVACQFIEILPVPSDHLEVSVILP